MIALVVDNENVFSLAKSVIIAGLTFLFVSTFVVNPLVTNAMIESQILSNGRYAIVYDAHETIGEFSEFKATAIGSSIIRDAVDGLCISQNMDSETGAGIFNLGISGGNPYTEMVQTQAVINSKTDMVLLELGPNNLWQFYDSQSLDDYIEFRFSINSITMEHDDVGSWTKLIRDRDLPYVALSDVEKIRMSKIYSIEAIESTFEEIASELPEIDSVKSGVPGVGDDDWLEYLMTPTYKSPNFELKSSYEVRTYFEENMPKLANGSIYKPKSEGTLNHNSYEYILRELTKNGIEVLLLGIPHHPHVYEYLSENQLDEYNLTFAKYAEYDGVYGMNMFWEEWPEWMFRDRNHLGSHGREYACERIATAIDSINNNQSEILPVQPTLEHFLDQRSQCDGSDLTWTVLYGNTIIPAEGYSFCSMAKDERLPHRWEKGKLDSGIRLNPDIGQSPRNAVDGPMVGYNVTIQRPGWYFFWFETRGESTSDDTFAVSFERPGLPETSISVISSFPQGNGEWIWTNESSMAPLKMWVQDSWDIKVKIWMQEDGVELKRILISNDSSFIPTEEVIG